MEEKRFSFEISNRSEEMKQVVAEAKKFLFQTLCVEEIEFSEQELDKIKHKLMKALKVIVCDRMLIKPECITIGVDKFGEVPEHSDAVWIQATDKEIEEGLFGRVYLSKDFFKYSTFYEFVRVILHELGHAFEDLCSLKSDKYPKGIESLDVDGNNKLDLSLFLIEHDADKSEYLADMFAYYMLYVFIKESRDMGFDSEQLRQVENYLIKDDITRNLNFIKGKVLKFVTAPLSLINKKLKRRQYATFYSTNPYEISRRNEINADRGFRNRLFAETRVRELEAKPDMTKEERIEYADLLMLYLAKDTHIDDERIGLIMGCDTYKRPMSYMPIGELEEDELVGAVVFGSDIFEVDKEEFISRVKAGISELRDSHAIKEQRPFHIVKFRRNGKVVVEENE